MIKDAERRRALEQRRLELQETLQLQAGGAGVKRTLDYFAAHGIPYTLEPDTGEGPSSWVIDHFPYVGYTWVRLEWERVSGAVSGPDPYAPEPEVIAWFDALEAAGRIGDCDVVLITDQGGDPLVHVRFGDIRAHPGIFQQDGKIWWIVCLSGRGVIQQGNGEPWWWGRAAHSER